MQSEGFKVDYERLPGASLALSLSSSVFERMLTAETLLATQ